MIVFGIVLAIVLHRRYFVGKQAHRPSSAPRAYSVASDSNDPYKCRTLLEQGHWLDPLNKPHTSPAFENWQPPGCMMHTYIRKDIQTCLAGKRLVYIGDSTARQLFWATAKKLNATATGEEMRQAGKHEDLMFTINDITLSFAWDPFLNTSSLELAVSSNFENHLSENEISVQTSGFVVVGGGLWYARHFRSDWLVRFQAALDHASTSLQLQQEKTRPLYVPTSRSGGGNGEHVYMLPVQEPLYNSLSPSRASNMTPARINPMNEYISDASKQYGIKVPWSHSLMTQENDFAYEESGLHVIDNVASRKVDVILNMQCNAELTMKQGSPFNKTCCSAYEHRNTIQASMLLFCLVMSFLGWGARSFCRPA